MNEYQLVGGRIYKNIEADERVTPDLAYCLFCKVSQSGTNDDGKSWYKDIDYKIPLNCVNGNSIKECPACKKIYILRDRIE